MPSSLCFNLNPSNPNGRGALGEDRSWSRFSSSPRRGCALSCTLLSHSERLSVISPFRALFRSGEGFSPQPEVTEKGWKRQGRRREIRRWTIGLWLDLSGGLFPLHVDEINPNMTILSCFHFRFCYFQYSFDTSSCLQLCPWFSPSGLFFQVVCLWKNVKPKNWGKTRDSRGRIKGKKDPPRRCSQKYLTSLSPLFSICDNTSLIVFLYSFLLSSYKITHFWNFSFRKECPEMMLDQIAPLFTLLPYSCQPSMPLPPITTSPLYSFISSHPSIASLFLLFNHSRPVSVGDSGSFLMSSEMWSRDHSETRRHRPSPSSRHLSIIYALIFISGMKTFSLKWGSFFMSWSGV